MFGIGTIFHLSDIDPHTRHSPLEDFLFSHFPLVELRLQVSVPLVYTLLRLFPAFF
jgi:hypothetical protein